jgi:serine protein kinase
VIRRYPAFEDFHGMEECIDQIVSYFRHAAQGLEEKKQILYLLGPVGGGKSSLAEKLKQLMEKVPFYAIKGSPVFESPLGLFNATEDGAILEEDFGIPRRYLNTIMSPWATKRLAGVRRRHQPVPRGETLPVDPQPDRRGQDRTGRREQPGHLGPGGQGRYPQTRRIPAERRRRLQLLRRAVPGQPGPDGIRRNVQGADQGAAPIAHRHPGRQLQQYRRPGRDSVTGILLAHSNESEWHTFRNNKNNEAFIDRIYIVKVPYCLRVSDEIKIYDKLLFNSSLAKAHCAPDTLKMLAQFTVLSRLKEPENSNIYSKMRVYDGENLKDTDPKAKSIQEYRDSAASTKA